MSNLKTKLRTTIKSVIFMLGFLAVIVCAVWFKPLPNFPHHEPRALPWTLPDFSQATTQVKVLDDGTIHIQIEHLPLLNIEPKMVSHFYKVLPISTVNLNGEVMPLYHIFHPTEHGYIYVVEAAQSGEKGMVTGAVIGRKEWFGRYNSQGAGRILKMDNNMMVAQPEMLGLKLGLITHRFIKTQWGTQYTLDSIIGSDLPVVGPLINYYIRNKIFSQNMMQEWVRHQVQEVSSLQFFAKELYQQVPINNQFILNTSNR
jgi:hypothetical protein